MLLNEYKVSQNKTIQITQSPGMTAYIMEILRIDIRVFTLKLKFHLTVCWKK